VSLDLKFRHASVSAHFRLVLDAHVAGVEIDFVNFDEAPLTCGEGTQRLAEAIMDARLEPAAPITGWSKPGASSSGYLGDECWNLRP
jgi:hypothetical protein